MTNDKTDTRKAGHC